MAEKDEEQVETEIVRGLLPFDIDGVTRHVPELKWRPNRAWHARMQEVFASLVGVPSDTPDGLAAMGDAQRQLILAYDAYSCPDYQIEAHVPCDHAIHAVGDLEDATERDIDAIYNRLIEVSFPLAASQTAIVMAIIRAATESAQANSMNGPSPTGTSEAPTILKPRSPSARSSSSTRRRKSA